MSSTETPATPETPTTAAPTAAPTPTTQYEIGKKYNITSKARNLFNMEDIKNEREFYYKDIGKTVDENTKDYIIYADTKKILNSNYHSFEKFQNYLNSLIQKDAVLNVIDNDGTMHFTINYGWDYTLPRHRLTDLKINPEQITTGVIPQEGVFYKIDKINSGGKKSRAKKNTRKSRRNRKSKRYNRRR